MHKIAREQFALNLARLLEHSGYTQADLVRELGMRRADLTEDENNLPPRPDSVPWLSDGLICNWAPCGASGRGAVARNPAKHGDARAGNFEAIKGCARKLPTG